MTPSAATTADDQVYAQAAADLQAHDAQARSTLDQATAELQAAYAQLAAKQAQAGSDTGTGSGSHEEHEEHEEREEREEHDD